MKKTLFSFILLFSLGLSACRPSTNEINWQDFDVQLRSSMPVYVFDVQNFFKEADPYKSALYFHEEALNFLNADSRDWTRLQILDEACGDREPEYQDATHIWWTFPYDETRCFQWKIQPDDLEAMKKVKASMTWSAQSPQALPSTNPIQP